MSIVWSSILLVLSLGVILVGAEMFTNGVEWAGRRLKLGEAAVGSLLAAVGTALPETMIPLVALVFSTDGASHEIGIGAIAGAPFMLGTLALFVTGIAIAIYTRLGRRTLKVAVNSEAVSKDMAFFLVFYTVAVSMTFVHVHWARVAVAGLLMIGYVFYARLMLMEEDVGEGELSPLHLSRLFTVKPRLRYISLQIALALAAIVLGAELFVENTERVATFLGASPLILALIIAPIATELPEKFNSVIWVGRNKDTLALGNITGAMVFQSSFPVSLGLILTAWDLSGPTIVTALLALGSILFNFIYLRIRKTFSVWGLLAGGLFYLGFIIYLFA